MVVVHPPIDESQIIAMLQVLKPLGIVHRSNLVSWNPRNNLPSCITLSPNMPVKNTARRKRAATKTTHDLPNRSKRVQHTSRTSTPSTQSDIRSHFHRTQLYPAKPQNCPSPPSTIQVV